MCNKSLLWLFAITTFSVTIINGYEMNMTEYFQMPLLYDFDDYDRCLQEYQNVSTYCFVRADIIPQNQSKIWNIIVDISQYDKHHFDHRHLYFGLCVDWCEKALHELNATEKESLYAGILSNNKKVNAYLELFSAEQANRQRYNHLLNQCLNLRLQHYGLKAESVIEYCNNSHTNTIEDDTWNLVFYITVFVLCTLTIFSSFFDLYLKLKRKDKVLTDRDHYKCPLGSVVHKICVTFSIARNWYRLNQEPSGKIGRDLRFLDCFKFFCMFLVIFAHSNWVIYESAIVNPQDPERMLHTVPGTLLVSGSLITVTFFVIGGLLLTISWIAVTRIMKERKMGSHYMGLFITFNFFRYLRLTVPYAFVILLSGVYFDYSGGPMGRHIMEREQLSCRKNWWANLLYINNYVNPNERCLLQSWYLAADTHSFILSLVILMISDRWPKIRNYLLGVTFGIFFALPGFVAYFKEMNAIFLPTPQVQRDSFIENRQFNEFYTPFYMNFACYLAGVIAALIYDEISTRNYKLHQVKLFQVTWYALIPGGIIWLFSAHPIYQYYYKEEPLFWGSVYASLQRNLWGFGLCIFIVGMSCKVGWVFKSVARLPIFRFLGRLTFGAFIMHLFVARLVIATIRTPIYFGTGMMFCFIFYTMLASYLLSFILAILLELPVSSLLKLLRS